MSIAGKWFGFGKSEAYDEGMRCYDRGDFNAASQEFEKALSKQPDPATGRLARFYLPEVCRGDLLPRRGSICLW
jgi:TolA-binding protein